MKNIIKLLSVAMLLSAVGCTDLTELNQNPAKSTTMDPNLLIPTIQASHAYGYQNCMRYLMYPAGWTNHWTGQNGIVSYGGKAAKHQQNMERLWTIFYPEAVKNITALESLTNGNANMANLSAICKVLRVETYLKLTDYYGDLPYFEGGQGYHGTKLNPKYDKQQDIYMDFFTRLDQAYAQFDATKARATYDFYFNGDVEKWKRFTASLKLRIAMRLIKVDENLAKQKATEAIQMGVMTSNADIAAVKYGADTDDLGAGNGYANGLGQYVSALGPTQYRLSTDFFKTLTIPDTDSIVGTARFRRIKAQDPRLLLISRCYTDAKVGAAVDITDMCRNWNRKDPNHQAPQNTATTVDQNVCIGGYLTTPSQEYVYGGGLQTEELTTPNNRSVWAPAITNVQVPSLPVASVTHHLQRLQPSKWVNAANSPWIHMSYAETQFMLAETTLRGWGIDSETVASRYAKGYVAAVEQWSLFGAPVPDATVINAYLNTHLLPVVTSGGTDALREVIKQIWILHALDPIEAWSVIRRTDRDRPADDYARFYNRYPNENNSNGKSPRRFQYPLEEQTKNSQSYQEAVARMGGTDDWMTRIWWDVE